MPNKVYQYLQQGTNSVVYANSANLKDQLTISSSSFTPRGITTPVYRHGYKLNREDSVPGADACSPRQRLWSVNIDLQGALETRTQQITALEELVKIIKGDERVSNGFKPSPIVEYTIVDAGV